MTEVLNTLQTKKLNIHHIKEQCCDNGVNMPGKYKRLTARILKFNNLALFVSYAAHNLNLTEVHAGSITPEWFLSLIPYKDYLIVQRKF